jgi:hypothetical protein
MVFLVVGEPLSQDRVAIFYLPFGNDGDELPLLCRTDYFQRGRIHERDGVRSVEYWCLWCGKSHTRKNGIEDSVFVFFPSAIEEMASNDVKPLFL